MCRMLSISLLISMLGCASVPLEFYRGHRYYYDDEGGTRWVFFIDQGERDKSPSIYVEAYCSTSKYPFANRKIGEGCTVVPPNVMIDAAGQMLIYIGGGIYYLKLNTPPADDYYYMRGKQEFYLRRLQ